MEHRLYIDSATHASVDIDSFFNDAYAFVFGVWIRCLRPIFPLSKVEICLA